MNSRTKSAAALVSILAMTPVTVLADDIGIGRSDSPPAVTDPEPMETESSWWDELLELFEFESE